MASFVHFDIPVDNIERAKSFYENIFGWKIEKVPGEIPYYLIETREKKKKKGLGGGMAKREKGGQQITSFIGVPSVDEYTRRIEELGGKIVDPKTPVPGWGYLAICCDTENNTFGLWEDDENAKI